MYKYNCRKCPIRNRCIDESANSPTIKETIRRAFMARTDTLDTWGLLQPNCLLLKAEEERARIAPRESMLSRRLRQAREAREQAAQAISKLPGQPRDYLQPVSPTSHKARSLSGEAVPDTIGALDARREGPSLEGPPAHEHLLPCWFTIVVSKRHITLPANGELVLGRFDPNFGIPPDIDLTYEDQGAHTVSRRHAKIIGAAGRHTIEDLGSRHGLFINGERIRSAPPHPLQPGDRVSLGNTQLLYEVMPAYLLDIPRTADIRHFLIVTPTGHRLAIAPPKDILIGRTDRYVNFVPDIDLSREGGDIAIRVSRRHAIITWRHHSPYLEDLGSGFGTRLNGEILLIGQAVPLRPGDHIWLGGCVLAYDVEL
jgi:pSer/pThr/pTyr-binding forkhead associated (FHA) protein